SAPSGAKMGAISGSISLRRARTLLYCSTQKELASWPLPVHSDCIAIRAVLRSTFTSLAISLSLSIDSISYPEFRLRAAGAQGPASAEDLLTIGFPRRPWPHLRLLEPDSAFRAITASHDASAISP